MKFTVVVLSSLLWVACATSNSQTNTPSVKSAQEIEAQKAQMCLAEPSKDSAPYDKEIGCGDVHLLERKVQPATQRWYSAFKFAQTRTEQCQAVERIRKHALDPDATLGQISQTIRETCKEMYNKTESLLRSRNECISDCELLHGSGWGQADECKEQCRKRYSVAFVIP